MCFPLLGLLGSALVSGERGVVSYKGWWEQHTAEGTVTLRFSAGLATCVCKYDMGDEEVRRRMKFSIMPADEPALFVGCWRTPVCSDFVQMLKKLAQVPALE